MKTSFRRLAGAICVALCGATSLLAQQTGGWSSVGCAPAACDASCCDTGCNTYCDPCCSDCDGQWGGFAEAELLFFRYHRADGVRIGTGASESGEFNFEPAGRYTVGIVGPGGMGMRARYFRYNHFQTIEDLGDGLGVETYNFDVEGFDSVELSDVVAVEASAGFRYNEFRERMLDLGEGDSRFIQFNGGGLVAGLEIRRLLGSGHLYARARGAVIQNNKDVRNVDGGVLNQDYRLLDVTTTQMELAWGYETNYQLQNGAILFARSGVEWQNWANYSNEFDAFGETFFDGPSDVGFAGFTLSGGVAF